MSTISSRRFFIVVALLVTAVAGALLRSFSAPQSTPYYLGTLLMVLWVPVLGNVISFVAKRARGAMARYAIDHRIDRAADLRAVDAGGYRFQSHLSSDEEFTFARPQPPLVTTKRPAAQAREDA